MREARDGEPVLPGCVYIAPGGKHMVVRRLPDRGRSSSPIIGLNENPPENSCRPSVDVLFRSLAAQYEGNMLAVVMTGMGNDGCEGVRAMKRRGCLCLTQSEATCIVYGMPLAVDEAGLSDEQVALDRLAERIAHLVRKGRGNDARSHHRHRVQAAARPHRAVLRDRPGGGEGLPHRDPPGGAHDRERLRGFRLLLPAGARDPDPQLRDKIVDAMTTNETLWFRDTHPFVILREKLLPPLGEELRAGNRFRIRIWSGASSTGQEAYSIAMTIHEFCRANPGLLPEPVRDHGLGHLPLGPVPGQGRALRRGAMRRGLPDDLPGPLLPPATARSGW